MHESLFVTETIITKGGKIEILIHMSNKQEWDSVSILEIQIFVMAKYNNKKYSNKVSFEYC